MFHFYNIFFCLVLPSPTLNQQVPHTCIEVLYLYNKQYKFHFRTHIMLRVCNVCAVCTYLFYFYWLLMKNKNKKKIGKTFGKRECLSKKRMQFFIRERHHKI